MSYDLTSLVYLWMQNEAGDTSSPELRYLAVRLNVLNLVISQYLLIFMLMRALKRLFMLSCSQDFVMYVGGPVWALDWCPRVHECLESHAKCEVYDFYYSLPNCACSYGFSFHQMKCYLIGFVCLQGYV